MRGCFLATGNRLPNFAQEFSWVLHHHPVRNAQQPYPPGSEIIFFRGIFSHLAGLRVTPPVPFDRQSGCEAVEINDPVLETTLAAKLGAQFWATQEIPRRSFGVGLGAPQHANTLGWDAHGASIAGLRRWGRGGSDPWRSNLINLLALGWTAFICTIMVMPPNVRTGISLGVVIITLSLLHFLTGPHEMRKPLWTVPETIVTKTTEP